jgi:hypothetical protein
MLWRGSSTYRYSSGRLVPVGIRRSMLSLLFVSGRANVMPRCAVLFLRYPFLRYSKFNSSDRTSSGEMLGEFSVVHGFRGCDPYLLRSFTLVSDIIIVCRFRLQQHGSTRAKRRWRRHHFDDDNRQQQTIHGDH